MYLTIRLRNLAPVYLLLYFLYFQLYALIRFCDNKVTYFSIHPIPLLFCYLLCVPIVKVLKKKDQCLVFLNTTKTNFLLRYGGFLCRNCIKLCGYTCEYKSSWNLSYLVIAIADWWCAWGKYSFHLSAWILWILWIPHSRDGSEHKISISMSENWHSLRISARNLEASL